MFVRVESPADNRFSGSLIDRTRPLRFTLDGVAMQAFAGDTVFSAALANGVSELGAFEGERIGVSRDLAPDVWTVDGARFKRFGCCELRARDGGEYWTIRERDEQAPPSRGKKFAARLGHAVSKAPPGFGLKLGGPLPMIPLDARNFDLTTVSHEEAETEVLVIGGGVSGLGAALDAADQGADVLVLEMRDELGGSQLLTGQGWGGMRANEALQSLVEMVEGIPLIKVRTGLRVSRISPGFARAVGFGGQETDRSHLLTIRAKRIVLATGYKELPLPFLGNRSPGVVGATDAFRLLRDHALAPGARIALATIGNAGLGLALRFAEHGIKVEKVVDLRPAPQSRYIDFLKAYGVGITTATRIHSLDAVKGQVQVALAASTSGESSPSAVISVDALVTYGGQQPDLDLWVRAGGSVSWNDSYRQLWPRGRLDGIVFAGLPDGAPDAALDPDMAPESPDGTDAVVAFDDKRPAPFLSLSRSFVRHDRPKPARGIGSAARSFFGGDDKAWQEQNTTDLFDLTAKVRAGEIPVEFIEVQIDEHSYGDLPANLGDEAAYPGPDMLGENFIPGVWRVRLGGGTATVRLKAETGALARGALLFQSGRDKDPRQAVGVVISTSDHTAEALLATQEPPLETCVARLGDRSIACSVENPAPAPDRPAADTPADSGITEAAAEQPPSGG